MSNNSPDPIQNRADEEAVWHAMRGIYDLSLQGDVDAVIARMAPDVTLWDSEVRDLALSVAHLQELRGRSGGEGPSVMPIALDASDPTVTVWGDTALLRHTLNVRFDEEHADMNTEIRNSSVWRRGDWGTEREGWVMVHNHEGTWAPGA